MHAAVEIILSTMSIITSDAATHAYLLIREVHSPQHNSVLSRRDNFR
jgi:hypothetical protein